MERFLNKIAWFFNLFAISALLLMFTTIALDILSSKILNKPITAAVDIVSLLATCVASFSLAQTILAGRHIEVEIVVMKMPSILRRGLNIFTRILSMLFFVLVAWRVFVYACNLYILKEASLTQHIPVAPFAFGASIACMPAIIIYAFKAYQEIKEGQSR